MSEEKVNHLWEVNLTAKVYAESQEKAKIAVGILADHFAYEVNEVKLKSTYLAHFIEGYASGVGYQIVGNDFFSSENGYEDENFHRVQNLNVGDSCQIDDGPICIQKVTRLT
jgi:hypothetical protein